MNDITPTADDDLMESCRGIDVPSHSMKKHAPELDRFLRDRDIIHVQLEYQGSTGRGVLYDPLFTYADGSPEMCADGPRNLQLEAMLRALLVSRHPDWCHSSGSCGDFHWNLQTDSLVHSHYLRGSEGNERITRLGA